MESVLAHTIYNDLGFIVKDRFVLLVEAQSKWNDNMSLRMLFYLAETYRRYLDDTKQSEHYPKRVKLPVPDFYVVYTGDKKVPEEISLNDDYFGGKANIDLKVKILKEVNTTLYGQYIGFCKIFDEQFRIHKNSIRCAEETVRICIDRNYLSEYLKNHRKEVITMMARLFDEETIRASYEMAAREQERIRFEEIKAEGRAEGRAEGIEEGIKEGEIQNISKTISFMREQGLPEEMIQLYIAKSKE